MYYRRSLYIFYLDLLSFDEFLHIFMAFTGCAAASVEHCLTLLRALATKPLPRNELYQQGLIQELMEFNLRRGTPAIRHEVRKLICLLTKDNREATNHLNKLLYDKIGMALKGHSSYPDLVQSVSQIKS